MREVSALWRTKSDLDGFFFKETSDELEWYKQKLITEEDNKLKLERLKEKGSYMIIKI